LNLFLLKRMPVKERAPIAMFSTLMEKWCQQGRRESEEESRRTFVGSGRTRGTEIHSRRVGPGDRNEQFD